MNLTALDVPRKGKVQNIKAPLDLRRKKSCSGTEAPWTLSDGPYGRAHAVDRIGHKRGFQPGASFSILPPGRKYLGSILDAIQVCMPVSE